MYLKKNQKFPNDFLFGASTSSFQVEGAAKEDGRGVAIHDLKKKVEGIADFSIASDHYHKYEEDIDLMKEMGLNAYRFSISWTRILPDGKTINPKGLEFYDKIFQKLSDYGIEPIVTIYHFEYPLALIEKHQGWISRESIDDYLYFAKILFERYGNKTKYWLTINEQDHIVKISERLAVPEAVNGIEYENLAQLANYHMCIAAAKVTKLCHEMIPGSKIGPAVNPMPAIPASNHPKDMIAAMEFNELSCYYLLDMYCRGKYSPLYWKYLKDRNICPQIDPEDMLLMKQNPPDFIGVNYYLSQTIQSNDDQVIKLRGKGVLISKEEGIYKIVDNKNLKKTDWGWDICPEGLKMSIMDIYNRYELPILITENGLGAYDTLEDSGVHDHYRIEYLKNHLKQIRDCIEMGYPIIGYCAWSYIDLVSGREGMDKRYGFVYVNRDNESIKDLRRIKKDSFYWYQKTIAERGSKL